MNFPNLYDLGFEEMTAFLAGQGERPFRAKQLYAWLYGKGENDFAAMTDIPAASRARLAETARADGLFLAESLSSADGSTTKYLFGTDDGHYIETVFMKYKDRNSVCISAQVGCRMGCKFCASGKLGLKRNLTPAELALEVILTERAAGALAKNIVLMGIGEPLDNFGAVKKFIENITDDHGRDLSRRAITLSTCGLVPGIRRLAEELPQVNLAVSLHAPNDKLRGEIMPVTGRYGVAAVVAATQRHYETTHRRSTFEYTLIDGFNDSPAQARELAALLRGMNCLVNLIPLNGAEADRRGSGAETAQRFRDILGERGVPATIRRSLGSDIEAACGQLRLRYES
ncbi:MAG: 23S rRNA (adenine(2503)-C(2))-methyltransferase RlmN [Clostridiales Family XIII bacterium]|nr:23S rRNA (adenine(2503)-C(2))-methyltransferase RlmN [Clostridiales Family XIII bacterium]